MYLVSIITQLSAILWLFALHDPTIMPFAAFLSWSWIMIIVLCIDSDIYKTIKKIRNGGKLKDIDITKYVVLIGAKILVMVIVCKIMINKGYGGDMLLFFGWSMVFVLIGLVKIKIDINEMEEEFWKKTNGASDRIME